MSDWKIIAGYPPVGFNVLVQIKEPRNFNVVHIAYLRSDFSWVLASGLCTSTIIKTTDVIAWQNLPEPLDVEDT